MRTEIAQRPWRHSSPWRAAAIVAFLLAACGGDDNQPGTTADASDPTGGGGPGGGSATGGGDGTAGGGGGTTVGSGGATAGGAGVTIGSGGTAGSSGGATIDSGKVTDAGRAGSAGDGSATCTPPSLLLFSCPGAKSCNGATSYCFSGSVLPTCLPIPPECSCAEKHDCACLLAHTTAPCDGGTVTCTPYQDGGQLSLFGVDCH